MKAVKKPLVRKAPVRKASVSKAPVTKIKKTKKLKTVKGRNFNIKIDLPSDFEIGHIVKDGIKIIFFSRNDWDRTGGTGSSNFRYRARNNNARIFVVHFFSPDSFFTQLHFYFRGSDVFVGGGFIQLGVPSSNEFSV